MPCNAETTLTQIRPELAVEDPSRAMQGYPSFTSSCSEQDNRGTGPWAAAESALAKGNRRRGWHGRLPESICTENKGQERAQIDRRACWDKGGFLPVPKDPEVADHRVGKRGEDRTSANKRRRRRAMKREEDPHTGRDHERDEDRVCAR